MLKHIQNNTGCILADDMGLGKTLEMITLISYLLDTNNIRKKRYKIIIIASKTLIAN